MTVTTEEVVTEDDYKHIIMAVLRGAPDGLAEDELRRRTEEFGDDLLSARATLAIFELMRQGRVDLGHNGDEWLARRTP